MKLIFLYITCLFMSSMFYLSDALADQYSGVVLDQESIPVGDAIVRIQGTGFSTRTDFNGKFKIDVEKDVSAEHITAWKSGFYNSAALISTDNEPYQIILRPIEFTDNKDYEWLPSTKYKKEAGIDKAEEAQPCRVCHPQIVKEWKKDLHSGSATNPVFLAFFNGTDVDGNKDMGPGFIIDFENSNGNCAACHIPTMALKNLSDANPNDAAGIDKEGITCDFCHKIKGMTLDNTGETPGVLSYRFRRPSDGHQLFYGPFDDVFPGDDSYHPLYSESRYCAPCHHGKFWGILAYSEFQEWLESSYSKAGIHCQDCHMESDGKLSRFALKQKGGRKRDPLTIPSHVNLGINDKAFMKEAISIETNAAIDHDILKVTVRIDNTKAGHHYPTGNPMRNMILLVETNDKNGNPLLMDRGGRVPSWGGCGSKEDGNYAGLPGKGFAKVLKERLSYGFKFKRRVDDLNDHPVSHWGRVEIESDNRIPANGYDLSTYEFKLPTDEEGMITIKARLIFRRTYKAWQDLKEIDVDDMEIGRSSLTVKR